MEINNLSEAVEILNEVLHVCGLTIEDLSPRTRNELSSLTLVTPSMWDSMEAWYCQKALGFSDYPVSRYKFLHTIIYECEGHWEWKYSRLANLLNLNDLEVELPKINSLSELMERLCIPDMRLVDFIQDLPPNCLSRMASASFLNDDIDGKYLEGVEELFEQEGDFEWGDLLTHLSYILDPNDIIEIDLGGSSIDAVKFLRSIGQCEQGLPWLKITDLSKFQQPIRNEDVFQLMTRPVGDWMSCLCVCAHQSFPWLIL